MVLAIITVAYPLTAADLGRPLAVFVLPGLLTAVLGGWRPTLLVGGTSLAIASLVGISGPLGPAALAARLFTITLGVTMGAVGAAVRERQGSRLGELDEAMGLREAFQRALAPAPVQAPGLVAVSHYRPAERWMTFGGDFLDAVALADGRLAVLMGDVCGHGPREAAFGAALRAGWKGIALSAEPDPVRWVEALDTAFFRDGRMDTFVTLCTGHLDLRRQKARLVNAGHPRPLVLNDRTELLDLRITRPLGVGPPAEPVATEVTWCGEPMLFFTDGLIENPMNDGPPRRWGVDGLVAWLDDHPAPALDQLVLDLVEAATASRELRDDLALLVVSSTSFWRQRDPHPEAPGRQKQRPSLCRGSG